MLDTNNLAMSNISFCLALFFGATSLLEGQTFQKAVFHHHTLGTTIEIKRGDLLKIWAADGAKSTKLYRGKLVQIKDNEVYLTNRPPIALDKVQKIVHRPKGAHGLFLTLLILGCIIALPTTISFFASVASIAAQNAVPWLFGLMIGLMGIGIIGLSLSKNQLDQVHRDWKMEVVTGSAPAMQPVP